MLSLLRYATSRTGAVRTGAAHAARSRASRAAPAQQRCYASSTDVEHRVRATSVSHLDLVEIDRYLFRAPREQLWVPPGGRGVFGGQVMGQALRAATLALDGDEAWRCHSNHSYFVNAVDPSRDVLYRVRETSTRRSFATRSIDGIQNGNVIFKMIASFNVDRSLPSDAPPPQHQDAVPEGVPPPEDLPCYRDDIHQALERLPADSPFQSWFRQKLESPVDVRYCEPPPDPLDAALARPQRPAAACERDAVGVRRRRDHDGVVGADENLSKRRRGGVHVVPLVAELTPQVREELARRAGEDVVPDRLERVPLEHQLAQRDAPTELGRDGDDVVSRGVQQRQRDVRKRRSQLLQRVVRHVQRPQRRDESDLVRDRREAVVPEVQLRERIAPLHRRRQLANLILAAVQPREATHRAEALREARQPVPRDVELADVHEPGRERVREVRREAGAEEVPGEVERDELMAPRERVGDAAEGRGSVRAMISGWS